MRPTRGITWQSTYTWSKNLGINSIIGLLGASFTNPVERSKDYTLLPDSRTHDFRTNGTFALPIGPGPAGQQFRSLGESRRGLADQLDRESQHRSTA